MEYYTVKEVQDIFNISKATLDKMIKSGELPAKRTFGSYAIPKIAISDIINGKFDYRNPFSKKQKDSLV